MVTDPVCGMEIDPSDAVATSEWRGTTYYFCAWDCKTAFDKQPEAYLEEAPVGYSW